MEALVFPPKTRLDRALQLICGLAPALLGAAGAAVTAAQDDAIVRTSAGFAGIFRTLDLLVAAPAMLIPIGTRAARAGLASAVVAGICGVIAFDLARELVLSLMPTALRLLRVRRVTDHASLRLVSAVSAIAVATALLSPIWQAEASAAGGSVVGALLILGIFRARQQPAMAALLLGLCASYEPLVLLGGLVAAAPLARKATSKDALHLGTSFALGLVPLAIGAALSQRTLSLHVPFVTWFEVSRAHVRPWSFVQGELGLPIAAVCALGIALAARQAWNVVGTIAVGALVFWMHGMVGPDRYHSMVLVALLAAFILAAPILAAVVLAIARARVPFAEASAALVVVLELVLPIKSMDDTTVRRESRAPNAQAIWNDTAWGQAPPAAVVLVSDRKTMNHVIATRAMGRLRGDLLFVPSFDVQSREGVRARIIEPKLAPLYRDMALGVPPEELSLAQLSAERPVMASFDPKWDRQLSRHLVPLGLTARFEAEPRGLSERKKALDAFDPLKERLVQATIARKDAELAAATATLLRSRAIAMAATGERDMLTRSLDDLRAFAPDDAVGSLLVRRQLTSKGPIDVHDL